MKAMFVMLVMAWKGQTHLNWYDPVHQTGYRAQMLCDDSYMLPRYSLMVREHYYGPVDPEWEHFPFYRETYRTWTLGNE